MSGPGRNAIGLALAGLLALAAGCNRGGSSLCTQDLQCATGFSCDPTTGRCGCGSDSACKQGESCNAAGFCQPRLRCEATADCAAGSFCDSQSGACIPAGTCTQDLQCPPAQVCEAFTCVPGCRQTGDCQLDEVCRPCPAGTPGPQCLVGNLCVQGRCDAQISCPYGDICAPPPGDPSGNTVCQKDLRGPFCDACVGTPGVPSLCGANPQSYCLIDASRPLGQASFCGVDCSGGQECPNGYQCRDVRIVTAVNCAPAQGLSACPPAQANPPCDPARSHPPAGGGPGLVNDDCLAVQPPLVGAVCDPRTGRCAAQCLGTGEAGVQAFCSCIEDGDCFQDFCESASRTCRISGKPCLLGAVPDECQSTHRILCVKALDARLGDVGYCRIGQNCAPAPGFTCAILRGQ